MHTHPKSDAHGGKSVASQWRNRPFESQDWISFLIELLRRRDSKQTFV